MYSDVAQTYQEATTLYRAVIMETADEVIYLGLVILDEGMTFNLHKCAVTLGGVVIRGDVSISGSCRSSVVLVAF